MTGTSGYRDRMLPHRPLPRHRPSRAPRLLQSVIALVATTGLLVGCSHDPTPTPTSTSLFATEGDAFAAAEQVYRDYVDASNAIDLGNPGTFEAVEEFTTGRYQSEERKNLSAMHANGYVSGGNITVEWFSGVAMSANDNVTALACNDVSETTLFDRNGVSIVSPGRPDRYAVELTFLPADGRLKISSSTASEDSKC